MENHWSTKWSLFNRPNKSIVLILFIFFTISKVQSQSIQRPIIYTTNQDKEQLQQTIENYAWAKGIVEQLHKRIDKEVDNYLKNPKSIFTNFPKFALSDHQHGDASPMTLVNSHNRILTLASESAILYYLSNEKKYAQFSADILEHYFHHISKKTPETTTICGNAFYDPRTTYEHIAIAYDFLYNYLNSQGVTVYNRELNKQIDFDNQKAQKALLNMVGNTLQEYGKPDKHGMFISNHPILTAPGVLFGILCIDDDKERERLFNVFWETGTAHQNSFTKTILPMFGEQGIWPESTSYSFMPIVTMVINIVDRLYPEKKVAENNKHILEGNFLFDNLRMPDRRFVRYGDSKRNNDQTEELYRYTLNLAIRKGFKTIEKQAKVALYQSYKNKGGYKPKIKKEVFNNYEPLKLFWGVNIPSEIDELIDFQKPTVLVKHAGIALQRNYVEKDNEKYGLCGIIGGAHYVHSHVTGITMELYGAGYVMAPNAGLPLTVKERRIPLHEKYFRLYAGNNTVIVNGTSHGLDKGSWKKEANVWQNTIVNIACEPNHLVDPVSKDFSFATQYLNDTVNGCIQERTLSTIRTSDTTAYYFDLFRSKSLLNNKFHDYIYHNIGDEINLYDNNNNEIKVKETDRYKNDIGDVVQSPGWRFFENTEVSEPIDIPLKVRFDVNYDNRYMYMFVPKGVKREYTKALAPPTREVKNGYVDKKTQVLAVRQQGEAWEKPFVMVFEPSLNSHSSVSKVEYLFDNDKVVGAKVVTTLNDKNIIDYIICQDKSDSEYINKELDLQFKGRFGIVRIISTNKEESVILYIGKGTELIFAKNKLESNNKGYKKVKNEIAN